MGKTMDLIINLRGKLEKAYPESMRRAADEAGALQRKIQNMNSAMVGAQAGTEKFVSAQRQLGQSFKDLYEVKAMADKFARLKLATQGVEREFANAQAKVAALAAQMRNAEAPTQTLKNDFEKAKSVAARLKSELTGNRSELQRLRTSLNEAGFSTQNFAQAEIKLRQEIQQTSKAIERQQAAAGRKQAAKQRVQDTGINALAAYSSFQEAQDAAGKLAEPFIKATKDAMSFESAMADVKKVVDFDTPQQFKEMNDDIIQLTRKLPMTAEEIAAIVAAGGQANIAREDLLGFAESAAKMGVAFDITAEQAGDMMAKWRTAFKMNQQQVVELADKVNYLGNTTAAAAPIISDIVSRIGPLGEVGGVASGEIAALGATMASANVAPEIAATGIKNMILAMTRGESVTKNQIGALKELKLNSVELAKRMQTDASGAILDLINRIKGLEKYKQASIIKEIFGSESIAPITTLINNTEALKENLNKVGNAELYAGSMEAEYAARAATTENKLKLAENAQRELSMTIGNQFLPVLGQASEKAAEYMQGLSAWSGEHQTAVQWLGLIAAAIGGVMVAATLAALVFAGWSFISAQLALMKASFLGLRAVQLAAAAASGALTVAQWLLNAAMTANPIGLVIVGIAALIAAGYLLISNWEIVKAWFIELWNDPSAAIGRFVDGVKEKIGGVVDWVTARWETMKSALSHPIDAVVNFVSTGSVVGGKVKANAKGGIYGKGAFLTTFAEESPEAAIPIDGSQRALSLWQQAGQMLGVMPTGVSNLDTSGNMPIPKPVARPVAMEPPSTRQEIKMEFSPTINITGGNAADVGEIVKQALREQAKEFEARFSSMLARAQANEKRLSMV